MTTPILRTHRSLIAAAMITAAATLTVSDATAVPVLPAIEDFESGNAAWADGPGLPATWVESGGFDGGGYLTSSVVVTDPPPPFGVIAFRAQDELGSSDGAFEGDWLAAGADLLSVRVRHNAPVPLSIFSRVAGPANFPSAVGVSFAPVLPGQWTELVFDLSEDSPSLVLSGVEYGEVFSNVGHLQIGFDGTDLGGFEFDLDLDQVTLIPAPAAAFAFALPALVGTGRRRRA